MSDIDPQNWLVIDIETTGLAENGGRICEVGWMRRNDKMAHQMFANPGHAIPAEASAVHHITDRMVERFPSPVEVLRHAFAPAPSVVIAHHAEFEQQFIDVSIPWICTYKVSKRLWPELTGHSNQRLRYELGLDLDPTLASPPHRAGPDAYVTRHIFEACLGKMSIDEMIETSALPVLHHWCHLKKHKGRTWEDVMHCDPQYLRWVADEIDDPNLRYTATYWLRRAR